MNKCVSLVLFFSTFLDYILCKCNFNYIFLLFLYFAVDLKKADEQGPADPRQGGDRVKLCFVFCVVFQLHDFVHYEVTLFAIVSFFVEIYEGEKETCYRLSCERRCHVG